MKLWWQWAKWVELVCVSIFWNVIIITLNITNTVYVGSDGYKRSRYSHHNIYIKVVTTAAEWFAHMHLPNGYNQLLSYHQRRTSHSLQCVLTSECHLDGLLTENLYFIWHLSFATSCSYSVAHVGQGGID